MPRCSAEMPSLVEIRPNRWVSCFLHEPEPQATTRRVPPGRGLQETMV